MTPPRRPPPAFPLTVLTGFLGAGKTTLLNRLLRDRDLADTVVLINEFGAVGLDHLLVEKVSGDMLLLASGCLCCSVRGDLVAMLEDLLRRRDNARMPPFRRVVIETTGLADPAPVLQAIMWHPYLALRYRLDGVVTLVDALHGEAVLDAHVEAVKQVAVADRIVLTKTDLVDAGVRPPAEAALRRRLRRLNPAAPILDAAAGEATAAALLNAGPWAPEGKIPDVAAWLGADAHRAAAAHQHRGTGEAHGHDADRHDASIRSFCLRADRPLAPAALDAFTALLRERHGAALLRVKGLVALSDDPARPAVIHAVRHAFSPPVRLAAWPDGDRSSRLVCIVRDLAPGLVEALWGAFTDTAAPDQADAAALTGSPLVRGSGGLLG